MAGPVPIIVRGEFDVYVLSERTGCTVRCTLIQYHCIAAGLASILTGSRSTLGIYLCNHLQVSDLSAKA